MMDNYYFLDHDKMAIVSEPTVFWTLLRAEKDEDLSCEISPPLTANDTHVRYHFIPSNFRIDPENLETNLLCLKETYYDTCNFDFVSGKCWISSRVNCCNGSSVWRIKMQTTVLIQGAHVHYKELSFSGKEAMVEYLRSESMPMSLRDKVSDINFATPFCEMSVDRYFSPGSEDLWVDVCFWKDGIHEKHYIVGTEDTYSFVPRPSSTQPGGFKVTNDVAPSKALLFIGLSKPSALASYSDAERNLARRHNLVKDHFQTSMIVGWDSSDEAVEKKFSSMPPLGSGDSDYDSD